MKKSPYQKALEAGLPVTFETVLEEIAARLAAYHGYPPILPHAGQVIFDVLRETKLAKASEYTDD